MKCDDLGERMADRWGDQLTDRESIELTEHLTTCDQCRNELENLDSMWRQLGDLEQEIPVPSERMRARFYGFLADQKRREDDARIRGGFSEWLRSLWPRQPQVQAALALGALAVGIAMGVVGSGVGTTSELQSIQSQLSAMSESVGLSLITHPSATERLRGVSLTASAGSDDRVVSALIDLVATDPSVNVRLAAIEALAGKLEEPGVAPGLLSALPGQSSPLLQMTLLDVLLLTDRERVLEVASPLLETSDLDDAVRERILSAQGESA